MIERLHSGGSHWGAIKVTKKKVTVADVTAGAEHDLRHLLESAVMQANADFAAPEEDTEHERSDQDQQMTDAFREFASLTRTSAKSNTLWTPGRSWWSFPRLTRLRKRLKHGTGPTFHRSDAEATAAARRLTARCGATFPEAIGTRLTTTWF